MAKKKDAAAVAKVAQNLGVVMGAQGLHKSGRRRKSKDSDYKLERVEISRADNGYVVTAHSGPKKSGAGIEYREPSKTVYKDHSSMIAGLSKNFGISTD